MNRQFTQAKKAMTNKWILIISACKFRQVCCFWWGAGDVAPSHWWRWKRVTAATCWARQENTCSFVVVNAYHFSEGQFGCTCQNLGKKAYSSVVSKYWSRSFITVSFNVMGKRSSWKCPKPVCIVWQLFGWENDNSNDVHFWNILVLFWVPTFPNVHRNFKGEINVDLIVWHVMG